jgi:signal transduction histidine kinase
MNLHSPGHLSVFALVSKVQPTAIPSSVTVATLLSLLRSYIDLLVEKNIQATLLVKLPPGNIWHSEIQRYYAAIETPVDKEIDKISPYPIISSKNSREYFIIILSPEFCSLTVAWRCSKLSKEKYSTIKKHQNSLLSFSTFDGKLIQKIVNKLQIPENQTQNNIGNQTQSNNQNDTHSNNQNNNGAPSAVCSPELISFLMTKQLQRQDEIIAQATAKRQKSTENQNIKLSKNLQVKDEYLERVCQELRTPLTHMKTALSLLNSPNIKPPQRQRYLQMFNNLCDRQNSLLTGVADLAQLEESLKSPVFETVRLAEIVPVVVSTYQPLAQEKGIMLAYTVPTELPAVWCIAGGLKQIVINLLSNSIKFTGENGKVWVRARLQGDFVLLEFRDTGIGIHENEIYKIFDRFYRVRSTTVDDNIGAGLGLTIVKELLSHCGGSISVKSRQMEGSTFTVLLPSNNQQKNFTS